MTKKKTKTEAPPAAQPTPIVTNLLGAEPVAAVEERERETFAEFDPRPRASVRPHDPVAAVEPDEPAEVNEYVTAPEPVGEPMSAEDAEVERLIAAQLTRTPAAPPTIKAVTPVPEVVAAVVKQIKVEARETQLKREDQLIALTGKVNRPSLPIAPAAAVATSSAASTAFVAAKVEGPGGFLWIDGNQKITAGNGSYDDPKPNAFSLVQIDDCPHSTEVCRASCYVHGLEAAAPATHALYRHNSTLIKQIVEGGKGGREWVGILAAWITEHAPGGFRWHVSGDIYSQRYADFIAAVIKASPEVDHWIYSRSFPFLTGLLDLPNLALNLSADRKNYKAAKDWRCTFAVLGLRTRLTIAYLCDDGSVPADLGGGYDAIIFPDYALRGRGHDKPTDAPWWQSLDQRQRKMVCPVDFFGKSERLRCGACDKCLPEGFQHVAIPPRGPDEKDEQS